jgi:ribosome biogenesis SPOUT family RNA methylase Rps3
VIIDVTSLPLGDDPPRDRTAELRVLGFPSRHLGPVQMTTDTALGVCKRVVQDKGDIGFYDMIASLINIHSRAS